MLFQSTQINTRSVLYPLPSVIVKLLLLPRTTEVEVDVKLEYDELELVLLKPQTTFLMYSYVVVVLVVDAAQ